MNRRKFLTITGGTIIGAGAASYLFSDKTNLERSDLKPVEPQNPLLKTDEREILYLASLAPSGHNTQPWFVQYLEPYHWIIGNDQSKWLPAVDPHQRETILSIGAFVQNLEIAAGVYGYQCNLNLLARTNQDERILDVKLVRKETKTDFNLEKMKNRRTVRSDYLPDELKKEDVEYLVAAEADLIRYLPFASKESRFINEQTIEANRLQTYRDPAQNELAGWIRFSSKDAEKYRDGLTTASMEIKGVAGWMVRNFYGRADVLKTDFREIGLNKVREQVAASAGWILITSKDEKVETLLETGQRMQKLFLKVRDKNIAIHPMTQILEEPQTGQTFNQSIGVGDSIQFILRAGYVKNYPSPVSLRRPVEWFIKT